MPKQLQRTRVSGKNAELTNVGRSGGRNAATPRLTLAQWCLLAELDEAGGSVRCHGRGPLIAGGNLVALGLAKRAHINDKHGEVLTLTEAGKLRAKAGP